MSTNFALRMNWDMTIELNVHGLDATFLKFQRSILLT